jgi:hypothetical protein
MLQADLKKWKAGHPDCTQQLVAVIQRRECLGSLLLSFMQEPIWTRPRLVPLG